MNKRINQAWLILIGVILIRGFAGSGINMTASLFLKPVADEIGVGIGTLSIFFSIASVVMLLWLPYAGKLMEKYNIRTIVLISAALQALSFAGLGLMNNVVGWYLLTIPQTIGAAILVNLLGPVMINRWFPEKTALMLGIQMGFVWLFAAFLQPLASQIIGNSGWRNGYFFIGLSTFAVVVVSALTLIKNKSSENVHILEADSSDGKEKTADMIEIPEKVAVRSVSFVMLLIFMISMTGTAVFTQHIPNYGDMIDYSINQVGIAMALSSVGSAIGSVAIGVVCDKIGGLKTCFGIIILWIVAIIGFLLSGISFAVFAGSAFLHGASSSSIAIISPILILLFYGKKDYEKIYAKVATGAPIASVLLVPLYGFIYDITRSYFLVLIFLFVLLLIAGIGILVGWKKRCTSLGCPAWRK